MALVAAALKGSAVVFLVMFGVVVSVVRCSRRGDPFWRLFILLLIVSVAHLSMADFKKI